MVQIKQMLVPTEHAKKVSYNGTNPKKYIVIHQTGNTSKGANAYMHAKLQYNGNSRSAGWHFSVDDKDIYQSFSEDYMLWHAGDGRRGKGNGQGIAIELCVNSDGNYNKTIDNGIALTKHLMKKHNIKEIRVINHHDASGKWCPSQILNNKNGINWNDFKGLLKGSAPTVTVSSNKAPSKKFEPYKGSVVDYLNQQGIKSNINNRKNLAVEYGIVENEARYTGTADQNTKLLRAMIEGEPKQEGTRKGEISSDYNGDSIVDYLVSIKADASIENRKKLAAQNGIKNYTGTASQNIQLLNKLRGGGTTTSTPKAKAKKYPLPNGIFKVQSPMRQGNSVRQIQNALASVYFYPDKGAKNNGIDGWYGPKTADAVKRFQSMHGLTADGIYGPATRKKLDQLVN